MEIMMRKENAKLSTMATAIIVSSLISACNNSSSSSSTNTGPDNSPPIAYSFSIEANQGETITIDPLKHVIDSNNDPLSVTSVSLVKGSGNVGISNNKAIFTPYQVGHSTLRYEVSDARGGIASANVTVIVGTESRYVGAQACLSCHEDKRSHLKTGHNFIMNKMADGDQP